MLFGYARISTPSHNLICKRGITRNTSNPDKAYRKKNRKTEMKS